MDKKLILLEHLAIAKTQITLNSKIDGVKLPPHLMGKDTVRLNLSNQLAIPTQFKTDKVVATLTFKGVPFECHIPYTSIYVIRLVNNIEDAVFFEESLPASTKRMVELFQNNGSLEALKFMAELENQFERDDVIVKINSDEKPQ